MTDRIRRMLDKATNTPITLGVEKIKVALETFDEERNCSNIWYRSALQANYYTQIATP